MTTTAKTILLAITLFFLLAACSPVRTDQLFEAINIDTPLFSISRDQPQPVESTPAAPIEAEAAAETEILAEDEQFLIVEEIIIGLLFLAVLVGIAARRLRVPYTVGLVLIGLLLTLYSGFELQISPNLILALLVPPLIFEAAFHLRFNQLRYNLPTILTLATVGVLLTTFLVGGIVHWGTDLALPVALVFGALVSATDPVSVVVLFRSVGAPKRLQVLLEGESLFNDGTAIVIFELLVVIALTGFESFNLVESTLDFLRVSGGGLAVGFVLGAAISQMINRIDDYLIETTLTSVLAYGAFLIAELLDVSGVLAVVAAGLTAGNIGGRGMSPTTRIVVFNFWEYAAFLANTFIFLLIGLRIELPALFENWQLILWAIVAILIARAVNVYGLSLVGPQIPYKWKHVMYWGGLRGAISLALALSLPASLASSSQVQVMAFGVVLFTLLVQGFSMDSLVRRLGLVERSEMQEEYERRHARAVASRVAYEHLERRHRQGLLSHQIWETLSPLLAEANEHLAESVREVLTASPSVEAEELDTARREALRAQRSALTSLLRDGVISEEIYEQLAGEVDTALTQKDVGWPEFIGVQDIQRAPITRMMAVVIQEQDIENALGALNQLGFSTTRMPSTGGFLGRKNTTLLIALSEGHEGVVVQALNKSCRKRVEYQTTPIPGVTPMHATPTPVEVGGATIFVFEVERFEIF